MIEFAGVDGTGSEWFARDSDSYRDAFRSSHVRRLHDGWTGPRQYFEGPLVLGLGTNTIAERVTETVARNRSKRGTVLAGYSRGGVAVIAAAQLLAQRGLRVDCLILLDAVDRTLAIDSTVIPRTVSLVLHARRHPDAASRESFGSAGTELESSGRTQYEERFFMGTHGALGGVPWRPRSTAMRGRNRRHGPPMERKIIEGGLDLGTNVTYAQDATAAREVWDWVSTRVRRHFGSYFRG